MGRRGRGRAPQLALIGREGSLIVTVHWYIDIFNDTGTLHARSEHAVTNNQSQVWWGPTNRVGAQYIVFVAPFEWENGMVRIKDLRMETEVEEDKQCDVKLADLKNAIKVESSSFATPTTCDWSTPRD